MSAALSVLESFASNTGIDHSKEMNVIHAIVAECE
ncbi:DNA modification methylase, partial [Klebsiella pneumoniae]